MNERHRFITGLIITAIAVVGGVWQWNELTAMQLETNTFSTDASNLTNTKSEIVKDNENKKGEVIKLREGSGEELKAVFPTSEDITSLTRLFDDFSVQNNFPANPFFIGSINYEAAEAAEGTTYRYVPVNLSLTASRKNLDKFIEYIETSGSLESGVRLMSIDNLRLSYPEEFGGEYSVEFQIKAYFSQEIDGQS